ncbi:MAG: alpha/beta hydrolase fold protein [Acidobacteriaceae bacterium]|nr:alpha/beta hydrolase fold protein [Acidobacteriaceae bacterium]
MNLPDTLLEPMFLQGLWMAGLGMASSVLADGSQTAAQTRSVRAGEQEIFYYDNGQGPVLLLVHGMFGDFADWEPVLEPLSKNYRVIAIDLPGFGASSKPNVDYTAEFFVGAIHSFLDELNIAKATLVGNSFGGIVCMLFAIRFPEQVENLVLIDSGGFQDWTDEEKRDAQIRFRKDNLRRLTPEKHQQIFSSLFVKGASAISAAYIKKQDAKLLRSDFEQYIHAINSSVQLALEPALLNRLPEISSRTLLLQGQQDNVLPLHWAQGAVRKFPNARLHVLPDCGHVPQLESGPEVVRLITEFVSRP